jgi:hypothetical protein
MILINLHPWQQLIISLAAALTGLLLILLGLIGHSPVKFAIGVIVVVVSIISVFVALRWMWRIVRALFS